MSLKGTPYVKDTFCIAPWTEIHFGVSKEVMPCCIYTRYNPFGNLNDTDDLQQIYNSENAKTLRRKLFNGEKAKECGSCWKQESLSDSISYRQLHNDLFGKYLDDVLDNTNEDFSLKKILPKRLDIRFDNKCNLKCRICNSTFSTSWYSDEVKLGIRTDKLNPFKTPYENDVFKKDVYRESIPKSILDFIIKSLPHVDELFFAGGEPLMQDNHYKILEAAIEAGHSKQIRLTYNTNFSSLKYKNKDIVSLWKKFQFVNIGASLDASHKQGEYQRKNLIWKDVVNNRKKLLKEMPDANFEIIPTIGILNVYNILQFHKEWIENKFILPNDIKINLLTEPYSYDIRNLPKHHKDRIVKLYNEHIEWLMGLKKSKLAINEFKKVIKYIQEDGSIIKLKEFINYNTKLDKIRDESFFNIYPEFSDLEWYLKYETLKDDVGEVAIEKIGEQKEKINKQKEYIIKIETERDRLNKKIAEKDSFISKNLHDKTYVKSLEKIRDELNKKIAEKDSFINKTLIDTGYLNQAQKIKDKLKDVSTKDISELKDMFDEIENISKKLTERINTINKENGYKSVL